MKNKYYICEYCKEEYLPKRRNHQKYCSSSCRSKAYHIRQRDKGNTTTSEVENIPVSESPTITVVDNDSNNSSSTEVAAISNEENQKTKIEAMSFAGLGNATAGALAAGMVKDFFTKEENKAVTKKDFQLIMQRISRYYKVNNLPKKMDQTIPIFDTYTGNIEYVSNTRALNLLDPKRNF